MATIKAPLADILGFAAYHAELGAHRLYLCLDAPDPQTVACLKAHPKVRVFACDAAHWRKLGRSRPHKHQVRQCRNASWIYERATDVDWLGHIDVDEFLWPMGDVASSLAVLPDRATSARTRPIEALDGDAGAYKAFIPTGPDRAAIVARLYPTFGRVVPGGFLSHRAGKLFLRTGLTQVDFRIHNVWIDGRQNPGERVLDGIDLCHRHVRSWEEWIAAYRFRHVHGAYRADLSPAVPGGETLHSALQALERDRGLDGLRAFYDELCRDTPALRARLAQEGLLRHCDLDLTGKIRKQFPDIAPSVYETPG